MHSQLACIALAAVALYYLTVAVALKFFLSGLVFLAVSPGETTESRSLVVKHNGAEALIREYKSYGSRRCAIYFPGRHGGIARYEKEIFATAVDQGITVYAISYPGYEGARGIATFESVKATTKLAIERIGKETSCEVSQSVFIGRSLGAAIALENALIFNPKGLLLDSASPSLAPVVRQNLKNNVLLWPAQLLPISKLLEFNVYLEDGIRILEHTPIVIFQGKQDELAKLENIEGLATRYANVELIAISNATHGNAILEAGALYFDKLCQLLECQNSHAAEQRL